MAERNRHVSRRALVALGLAGALAASGVAWAAVHAHRTPPPPPSGWVASSAGTTGLVFRYPASWHRQAFDLTVKGAEFSGAIVSNVAGSFSLRAIGGTPTTTWNMSALPRAGVAIELERLSSSPINPQSVSDTPALSTSARGSVVDPARPGLPSERVYRLYEGGQLVSVHEWVGAAASASDRRRAVSIIGSIQKQPGTASKSARTANGFSLGYPGNWRAQLQTNTCPGESHRKIRAIIVTNTSFAFRPALSGCRVNTFGRWVLAGFPRDGVAVALEPALPFPLDHSAAQQFKGVPPTLSDLHPTGGIVGGPAESGGVFPGHHIPRFEVRVWIGPDASLQARAEMAGILKTIGAPSPPVKQVPIPTCAPNGEPWVSSACPESVWVRSLVANAGGTIVGVGEGAEPQRRDAFVVQLDGWQMQIGAVSRADAATMGGWFSMGEFSGMHDSGRIDGIPLSGIRRTGQWAWGIHGFFVQVNAVHAKGPSRLPPRSVIATLVQASTRTSGNP